MKVTFDSNTEQDTRAFALRLAHHLRAGDTLLLSGPIGAGKTTLARHIIQSLLHLPEDVPSPSFTLVQEYDSTAGPIWHVDLYRLNGPDDVLELGLETAFDTAICLIEWPDRLGSLRPDRALSIHFEPHSTEDRRHVSVNWQATRWDALGQKGAL